jgi:hypothetical protein
MAAVEGELETEVNVAERMGKYRIYGTEGVLNILYLFTQRRLAG